MIEAQLLEQSRVAGPNGSAGGRRYLSVDVLRGSAIILMIQVHFIDNLSSPGDGSAWLYHLSAVLGSLPAPLFTFVSGLSYALWLRKQESARRPDEEVTRATIRRGLFLFGTGLALNFFVWRPEETFNWDVLTLLGASLLLLAYARKMPAPALVLACAVILLTSPLLRAVGDYPAYWDDEAYSYDFTFHDVLFGFVSNGYFPVFPWIVFPVIGFVSGGVVFRGGSGAAAATRWLSASGVGLLAVSALGIALGPHLPRRIARWYAEGLTEFPASGEYVVATLGLALLSLLVLRRWADRRRPGSGEGWLAVALSRYSAFSLTLYVLHHAVILWPLWAFGARTDPDNPALYWRDAMSPPKAFALFAVFMMICHRLLLLLEKHKGWALESVMRRLCD